MEQRVPGTLRVWAEPFTPLRLPKLFDLRADPYERADITSNTYYDWFISQPYIIFGAQAATVEVPGHVQGVPAPPAGRELQHRPGGGQDEAEPRATEQSVAAERRPSGMRPTVHAPNLPTKSGRESKRQRVGQSDGFHADPRLLQLLLKSLHERGGGSRSEGDLDQFMRIFADLTNADHGVRDFVEALWLATIS